MNSLLVKQRGEMMLGLINICKKTEKIEDFINYLQHVRKVDKEMIESIRPLADEYTTIESMLDAHNLDPCKTILRIGEEGLEARGRRTMYHKLTICPDGTIIYPDGIDPYDSSFELHRINLEAVRISDDVIGGSSE